MAKLGFVSEWSVQEVLRAEIRMDVGLRAQRLPGRKSTGVRHQGAEQDPALVVWVVSAAMEEVDGGGQGCSSLSCGTLPSPQGEISLT